MMISRCILAAALLASVSTAAFAESQRERQERACQADAMKFCKEFVPDEDKIAACMGQHRSQLSTNCGLVYDKAMQ